MPESFTVTSYAPATDEDGNPKTWSNDKGTFHVYLIGLRNSMKQATAEINRKPESPMIAVGGEIYGELTASQFGPRFKKMQPPGQRNGGTAPMDPAREARIVRQHSQEMALRYAAMRAAQGKLPEDFNLARDLTPIIDWFAKDAMPS